LFLVLLISINPGSGRGRDEGMRARAKGIKMHCELSGEKWKI